MNIVCSEWDIGAVSERLSLEDEVVLEVTGYLNHPMFNISIGPIGDMLTWYGTNNFTGFYRRP